MLVDEYIPESCFWVIYMLIAMLNHDVVAVSNYMINDSLKSYILKLVISFFSSTRYVLFNSQIVISI